MPQCLSPIDLDTKSPAILEFLHHHHHHHRTIIDDPIELQNHYNPYHQMFTTTIGDSSSSTILPSTLSLDSALNEFDYFYGQQSSTSTTTTSLSSSSTTTTTTPTLGSCFYPYTKKSLNRNGNRMTNHQLYPYTNNNQTPIDDYVYLEFFVDTIKPDYYSSTNDLIACQSSSSPSTSSVSPSTSSSSSSTIDHHHSSSTTTTEATAINFPSSPLLLLPNGIHKRFFSNFFYINNIILPLTWMKELRFLQMRT